MSYAPSPRPQYEGPSLIKYKMAARHLWGDEASGRVADWIYLSNSNLHALIFALPPGGFFTHSEEYRTIFGADEVMVVLEGQFALANPETGEVQPARAGEALFFRKDTWHHGFNLGQETVRVLEFFAPPPLKGTSGVYARGQPYLPREAWRYTSQERMQGFPYRQVDPSPSIWKIPEDALRWELIGQDRRALAGFFANTEHLAAGRIYLPPGARIQFDERPGDVFLYTESEAFFVYLPGSFRESWHELHEKDGFYLPAGTPYEIHNLSGQQARILFAVAPNTPGGWRSAEPV